jgi:hypothetical protein
LASRHSTALALAVVVVLLLSVLVLLLLALLLLLLLLLPLALLLALALPVLLLLTCTLLLCTLSQALAVLTALASARPSPGSRCSLATSPRGARRETPTRSSRPCLRNPTAGASTTPPCPPAGALSEPSTSHSAVMLEAVVLVLAAEAVVVAVSVVALVLLALVLVRSLAVAGEGARRSTAAAMEQQASWALAGRAALAVIQASPSRAAMACKAAWAVTSA